MSGEAPGASSGDLIFYLTDSSFERLKGDAQ